MMPAVQAPAPTSGELIMPAVPLSLPEREEIRAGIERGESITVIAQGLGRHRCTISAEVARNGGRNAYRATDAQARADVQRARPKIPILVARPALAAHVEARLRAKDSPMTIAVELARGVYPGVEGTLCHETIYTSIYHHGRRGLAKGLHVGLHRRRRCRKRRIAKAEQPPAKSPLGAFNPIASRPVEAEGRSQVGHLEGDLIIGAGNRSAIATVFDRASRHMWLADLPDNHSEPPFGLRLTSR
jgi:IS30 family transposase